MLKLIPFGVLLHVYTTRLIQFQETAALYDALDGGSEADAAEIAMHDAFDALDECVVEIRRRRPIGQHALQRVQALARMAELKDEPLRLEVA